MFTATLDDLYYQVTYMLYGYFLFFLKGSFILSFIILFMYVFLVALDLCCCTQGFYLLWLSGCMAWAQ